MPQKSTDTQRPSPLPGGVHTHSLPQHGPREAVPWLQLNKLLVLEATAATVQAQKRSVLMHRVIVRFVTHAKTYSKGAKMFRVCLVLSLDTFQSAWTVALPS